MSTHCISQKHDPYQLLERLLNNSSLSTKRVAHGNIIDVGGKLFRQGHVDIEGEKRKAIEEALQLVEKRHGREMKAALLCQEKQLEKEKEVALTKQRQNYEKLAAKVQQQRDIAEEQRILELRRLFDKEKSEALQKQWKEAEIVKEEAVREACEALKKRLRNEFALEKEKAVADALARARELFKVREQEAIARTREVCRREAEEEAHRVAQLHNAEISRHQQRYEILLNQYHREIQHRQQVESDFRELQADYKRFMDYTDGQYHSDYMMHLRQHGLSIAGKKGSVVTYQDVQQLDL